MCQSILVNFKAEPELVEALLLLRGTMVGSRSLSAVIRSALWSMVADARMKGYYSGDMSARIDAAKALQERASVVKART